MLNPIKPRLTSVSGLASPCVKSKLGFDKRLLMGLHSDILGTVYHECLVIIKAMKTGWQTNCHLFRPLLRLFLLALP